MILYQRRRAFSGLQAHPTPPARIVMRKRSLTITLVLLALLWSLAAEAQKPDFQPKFSSCRQHFAQGEPPRMDRSKIPGALRELCFEAFAVLHSGQSKTPVWVAQRLTPEGLNTAQQIQRSGRFYQEARLPEAERARLDDYDGSGWDRGHMAPAGDMPNETAMAQSFSLANVVPQAPELNRGVWANYEKSTRRYVRRVGHSVYVITGPVYTRASTGPGEVGERPQHAFLGRSAVWVPGAMFKLVYDPVRQRAWAYWSENANDTKAAAPISVKLLRQRLGHQWLPGVAEETILDSPD